MRQECSRFPILEGPWVLQITAGRALERADPTLLKIFDPIETTRWWGQMLADRARVIRRADSAGEPGGIGAIGPNSVAIELSKTTAEYVAAEIITDLAAICTLETG